MKTIDSSGLFVSLDGVESKPPGATGCGIAYSGSQLIAADQLSSATNVCFTIVGDDASYDTQCTSATTATVKYTANSATYVASGSFVHSFRSDDGNYNVVFAASSITQQ
jgi:hypothetical protein